MRSHIPAATAEKRMWEFSCKCDHFVLYLGACGLLGKTCSSFSFPFSFFHCLSPLSLLSFHHPFLLTSAYEGSRIAEYAIFRALRDARSPTHDSSGEATEELWVAEDHTFSVGAINSPFNLSIPHVFLSTYDIPTIALCIMNEWMNEWSIEQTRFSLVLQEFILQWKGKVKIWAPGHLLPPTPYLAYINQDLKPVSHLLWVDASGLTSSHKSSKAQRLSTFLVKISKLREILMLLPSGKDLRGKYFCSSMSLLVPICPAALHWRCVQQEQPITPRKNPEPLGPALLSSCLIAGAYFLDL